MLVLTRRRGEKVVIGQDVTVEVVDVNVGRVRLAFDAPQQVSIDREEVRIRKDQEKPDVRRLP